MDIICVNATFPHEWVLLYKKYNVVTPELNKIYSIREVIHHTTGKTGIKLNEIINPKVPEPHPVLGSIMMEPSWNLTRFRTLAGDTIKKEEIELINVD